MAERKKYTFIVEVIYNEVYDDITLGKQGIQVKSKTMSFSADKRRDALQGAKSYFNEIKTEGIKLQGGSIIDSRIMPSAFLQLGIVDLNEWEKEREVLPTETSQALD